MLVVNTQPFDLVYTLINHPYLGCIIEPHVVQKNSLGKFTLTHQRIFSKTSSYFSNNIDVQDEEIIKILDELDDDHVFRKFYTDGKKKIKTAEFFTNEKYCSKELFNDRIRPYIEQRLNKALNLLRGKTIYRMGNDNNPTSQSITVADEKASVLFHFRRNEEGTRYFPTIKFKGERVEFMYKGSQIISNQPAWMLLNQVLFDFEKEIDGKKLQPFLNKRFIQIAKNAEENYFNKFVAHLVEKYDVYAEGFQIMTEKTTGKSVLKVQPYEGDNVSLKLTFNYNNAVFEYGTQDNVCALVEKKGDNYLFRRIRRDRKFEEEQKNQIETLGLKQLSGAYFTLHAKGIAQIAEQLIPLETTNKYEFLEWMNDYANLLTEKGISIEQSDEFNKYFIGNREIKLEVKEQKDWFDIKANVTFGEFTFPFLALKENILKGKREFILPNGLIAVIPDEWFGNLAGMLEFSSLEEEIRLEKHHIGLIEELTNDGGRYLRLSDKLQKIKAYGEEIKEMPMPEQFKGELRPYQKAGFDWFYFLKENGFGGCLADDMGLGKTIQTLALLQKEKELFKQAGKKQDINEKFQETSDENKPQLSLFNADTSTDYNPEEAQSSVDTQKSFNKTSLIVVPNSLVYNWHKESRKFTPGIKTLVYTGINREKNPKLFALYDLIITTYGTVRVDIDILKDFKFNYVILDESQSIKNPNSLSSRAVKQLRASHKLVLTGTPIENSIQELWSQLSFINPGLVGSLQSFTERFVTPIEKANDTHKMQQLKAIIKPFVLRRTKDQVAKELPPKMEQVVYCNMSEGQADAYETVKSYFRNEILKSIKEVGLNKSQFALLQGLTKLRQIANHPKLTNESFEGVSGKFDEVMRMAETAKAEGHKVLLFSQFVKQLDIYRTEFDNRGWNYSYLDGSMSNEQRQKAVEAFQQESGIQFFLISLKAGGVGLNLTAADYVFIIDPWWNPAVEQQAIDRTHRIGQDKIVFTYKFISKDTVEEKILALQHKKKELASAIITTEESFIKSIDIDEILEMLS
ncbi:MAG: DEAD/DEAH box helicase [Sphingobacteriales bacterium]|nr:DEAD/DEAH box helicase [Sphingobacteriales bacterium]